MHRLNPMRSIALNTALLALLALGACTTLSGERAPAGTGANDVATRPQFSADEAQSARTEALYQGQLRKLPNDTESWFRLGNLYASGNRPEAAALAYQRALLSDNAHARAWHNLAVVRLREAYAALLQAQSSAGPDERDLAARIEALLEQLARVPALGDDAARTAPPAAAPLQNKAP